MKKATYVKPEGQVHQTPQEIKARFRIIKNEDLEKRIFQEFFIKETYSSDFEHYSALELSGELLDRLENRESNIIYDKTVYSLAPNQSEKVRRTEEDKTTLNQYDIWKKDFSRTSSYRRSINQ